MGVFSMKKYRIALWAALIVCLMALGQSGQAETLALPAGLAHSEKTGLSHVAEAV